MKDGVDDEIIIDSLQKEVNSNIDIAELLAYAKREINTPFPSATELLIQSASTFRKKIIAIFSIILIPFLAQLPLIIFVSLPEKQLLQIFLSYSTREFVILAIILSSMFIISFVIATWSRIAILSIIYHSTDNAFNAYQKTFRLLPSFLWINILYTFFIAGGSFFLIIPGMIFFIWFSMVWMMQFEKKGSGSSAFAMSRAYTEGYFFTLALRFISLGIFLFILSAIIEIGISFFPLSQMTSTVLTAYLTSFFSPFALVYIYYLFDHLKFIKGDNIAALQRKSLKFPLFLTLLGWAFSLVVIISLVKTLIQAFPSFDVSRNIDLFTIRVPLELYSADYGQYPKTLDELVPQYIESLPETFQNREHYSYTPSHNGQMYEICTLIPKKQCITIRR